MAACLHNQANVPSLCHSPTLSCFLGQNHTWTPVLTLSGGKTLSIFYVKGHATAVDTGTLLPSSSATCRRLFLTFSNCSVYFSKHGCRGPEGSGSVAVLQRNGGMEDDRELRGRERGFLCRFQLMHFRTIINRLVGRVTPSSGRPHSARLFNKLWWIKEIYYCDYYCE